MGWLMHLFQISHLNPSIRKSCMISQKSYNLSKGTYLVVMCLMTQGRLSLQNGPQVRKVQEKFRLDFTDEEAISYMQDLIDESASAVMAALTERIHRWAQFMRN